MTIAQAIDESGWGLSNLASRDHNLFGIKGTGPAGSDPQPTQEYEHGRPVTRIASFRVYHDAAESIDDHGRLLATSGYYGRAMAERQDPDAFAAALTGVYATDPDYGAKIIGLMRLHDLYRYDIVAPAAATHAPAPARAAIPGLPHAAPAPSATASPPAAAPGAPPPPPPATAPPPAPATAPPPAPAPPTAPLPPMARAAPTAPGRQSASYRPQARARPPSQTVSGQRAPAPAGRQRRLISSRGAGTIPSQYQQNIPLSVKSAFVTTAKMPLLRAEPLYRDVASHSGIQWELLAACDWMQCKAQPRYSPVHGEKLGTVNPDGTIYRTKSAALQQCADDLVDLAWAVYRADLTAGADLSVRDLANAFAAFRWGGLLKLHHTSALEFPYSVAGLSDRHINMRWPNIAEPNTPDKPGTRFRMPFGAVPIVLGLNYPATV